MASHLSARLPLEIFNLVISFTSDTNTLCSLARCCRAFATSTEPYLYATLKFTPGLRAIQLARVLVRCSRKASHVLSIAAELVERDLQPFFPAGCLGGLGGPVTSLTLYGQVTPSQLEATLPVLAQTSTRIEYISLQAEELSAKLLTLLSAYIPSLTRLEIRIVRSAMVAYSNLTSESVCQALSLLPNMKYFRLRLWCPQLFYDLWFHAQREVALDWREYCPSLSKVVFESSSHGKAYEWSFDEEAMDWVCSMDEYE
ncbi:hypothetical protein OPQ81_009749 [Rhizoctonia solani]|nr:hypothetical protein OPQ81_009749 [Rhizoctonia solani]